MDDPKELAFKFISFQKSLLDVSTNTYNDVIQKIKYSDYFASEARIEEFLHLFIEAIDRRPQSIQLYVNLIRDYLSSNQCFLQLLQEFLFSENDRKSRRIFFLFSLFQQLNIYKIEYILEFIHHLFQEKEYQYMRIHRKLTLTLFCYFLPELYEQCKSQNQLEKYEKYFELFKVAYQSPYFKTLSDVIINFLNDFDELSNNHWTKLKEFRTRGKSYDPAALAIVNDSIDDLKSIIESTNDPIFDHSNHLNGKVPPCIFECCSFLNHNPTYIMYAAFHGSINVFHYLLENGADRTILDDKNRRVEDYAIAGGCKEIIDIVFDLYFKELPVNEQFTVIPNHHEERRRFNRPRRNNPFDIGAERTFQSCSNRIMKRQTHQQPKGQMEVSSNSILDSNNSSLVAQNEQTKIQNQRFYSNYNVAKFNRCGLIEPQIDESIFFECCKCDCLELVVYGVDNALIDVNSINKHGTPAISIACQYGNVEIVRFLSNLHLNHDITKPFLVDLSATDEQEAPPLVRAAMFGQLPVVRYLASRSTSENIGDVDINGGDERETTALIFASMKGYLRMVDFLIKQKNVDLNAMDEYYGPSFVHAAMHGHLDVLQLLATKEKNGLNMRGEYVSFAIIYAANRGYTEVIKYLLTKDDIDLNLTNIYNETVLTSAATGKQLETLKFLVTLNGIDLNQRGPNGNSALLSASVVGALDIVQFLCSLQGVDIHLKNNYEANCLDLAISNKHPLISDYLRTLGLTEREK